MDTNNIIEIITFLAVVILGFMQYKATKKDDKIEKLGVKVESLKKRYRTSLNELLNYRKLEDALYEELIKNETISKEALKLRWHKQLNISGLLTPTEITKNLESISH